MFKRHFPETTSVGVGPVAAMERHGIYVKENIRMLCLLQDESGCHTPTIESQLKLTSVCMYRVLPRKYIEVLYLATDSSAQGSGHARTLMAALMELVKQTESAISLIFVDAVNQSMSFWLSPQLVCASFDDVSINTLIC